MVAAEDKIAMLKTPKAKIFFKLKGNFLFVIIYINAFFNM